MLRHKQIPWQEKHPDGGYGSDQWRKKIPAGNLPALEHDGLMLTDSEVIAEYLEEVWPETSMQANTPLLRALVRQRSRFHDTRLEPSLRGLFGWLSTGHDTGDTSLAASVETKLDIIQQRLDQLGQLLEMENEQLSRSRLWLGDCGFAASFPWLELIELQSGRAFDWPEQVLNYYHQLEAFPAIAAEYTDYRHAITSWMETRLPRR